MEALFGSHYGGSTHLHTVAQIKEELMNRGPVVSLSFAPSKDFCNRKIHSLHPEYIKERSGESIFKVSNNEADTTSRSCIRSHPVVIYGWTMSEVGEAWLVRNYRVSKCQLSPDGAMALEPGAEEYLSVSQIPCFANQFDMNRDGSGTSRFFSVGFGQFGITDDVIVPQSNLRNRTWEDGPYVDRDDLAKDIGWLQWDSIRFNLTADEFTDILIKLGLSGEMMSTPARGSADLKQDKRMWKDTEFALRCSKTNEAQPNSCNSTCTGGIFGGATGNHGGEANQTVITRRCRLDKIDFHSNSKRPWVVVAQFLNGALDDNSHAQAGEGESDL